MAVTQPELHRICGTVIDLHSKSGDNWSRAKIRTLDGSTFWVTAKFKIETGETFEADCTYNERFRSYDCVKLAVSEDGQVSNDVVILKLIDCLDGVGQVKAHRLGDQFSNLYETLLKEPKKIADACGVDLRDVQTVANILGNERAELIRVSELVNRGFPNHLAKRIAKDDRAYRTALESPYAAIKLVNGLGWLLADEIGRKQKIALDDPRRIEAGIDHHYREKITNDGHTIVFGDDLLNRENLPNLLGLPAGKIAPYIDSVLIPRGDGWYTSKRHLDNATIISEFFYPQG